MPRKQDSVLAVPEQEDFVQVVSQRVRAVARVIFEQALEMAAPGAFALRFTAITAGEVFLLRVIFGVLVGALYTAFVG
jgi:hypothetical protein